LEEEVQWDAEQQQQDQHAQRTLTTHAPARLLPDRL